MLYYGIDINGTEFILPEYTSISVKGKQLQQAGKLKEAYKLYTDGIKIFPKAAVLRLNRGNLLFDKLGKNEEGLKDLDVAFKLAENSALINYNRGLCLVKLSRNKESVFHFKRVIELLSPAVPVHNEDFMPLDMAFYFSHFELGKYYMEVAEIKDFKKANDYFTECIRLIEQKLVNPKDPSDAYRYRGLLNHWDIGNWGKAEEDYEIALKLNPNDVDNWRNMGTLYNMKTGDHKGSFKYWQKCVELDPGFDACWSDRAHYYKSTGNYRQALKDYKVALKLNPKCKRCFLNIGNIYQYNMKDTEKNSKTAMKMYAKAIKLYPDYALAFFNRGNLYERMGRWREALSDFNQAKKYRNHPYNQFQRREVEGIIRMRTKLLMDIDEFVDNYDL